MGWSAGGRVGTHLVGLVVKLLVILLNLSLLGVVPNGNELVELGVLSPFLAVDEPDMVSNWFSLRGLQSSPALHLLRESNVELPGSQESQL